MIQIDMEMPKNCLDCNLRYQSFCSVDGHHEPHLEKERCPLKVTPQEPRKGHWIADVDKWGDVVTTVNGYRCDKCNAFNSDKDNFCPNCGAKMESEE